MVVHTVVGGRARTSVSYVEAADWREAARLVYQQAQGKRVRRKVKVHAVHERGALGRVGLLFVREPYPHSYGTVTKVGGLEFRWLTDEQVSDRFVADGLDEQFEIAIAQFDVELWRGHSEGQAMRHLVARVRERGGV